MKQIFLSSEFKHHFKLRISKNELLTREYKESVEAFLEDKTLMNDHPLEDVMSNFRAFWINDDYRVVYQEKEKYYLFTDIGTHEQVYRGSKRNVN